MTLCKRCRTGNSRQATHCINCGYPLQQIGGPLNHGSGFRFCPNCGGELIVGAHYCADCGHDVLTYYSKITSQSSQIAKYDSSYQKLTAVNIVTNGIDFVTI